MARRPALQFKIVLEDTNPPIWRRIQVSDLYSFWDLHVAIQDAMGWQDCHLHHFITHNPSTGAKEYIGIPEECYGEDGFGDFETLPGWDLKIRDYFKEPNVSMEYEYDFGDGWMHTIEFEGPVEKESKAKYPRCIGGERACPPEDVGGVSGYEHFCIALRDPQDEMHQTYLDWSGGHDPEDFDCNEVRFDNPSIRFDYAFSRRGM